MPTAAATAAATTDWETASYNRKEKRIKKEHLLISFQLYNIVMPAICKRKKSRFVECDHKSCIFI